MVIATKLLRRLCRGQVPTAWYQATHHQPVSGRVALLGPLSERPESERVVRGSLRSGQAGAQPMAEGGTSVAPSQEGCDNPAKAPEASVFPDAPRL